MLPELRARRALTSVGLRPNIALEAVESVNNEVWMTDELVVRVSCRPDQRLRREAQLSQVLPNAVGYPPVLGYGAEMGSEWLVLGRLPGLPLSRVWPTLTREARRQAIRDLAERLRLIHATPVPALAPLRHLPQLLDPAPSGTMAVARLVVSIDRAGSLEHVDRRFTDDLSAMVQRLAWCLEPFTSSTLIHGDLSFENILYDPAAERLEAILDFEWARGAPRDLDLDVFLRFCAYPDLHVPASYAGQTHARDYAEVPYWLAEAYPELFSAPEQLDRCRLFAIAWDVEELLAYPPTTSPAHLDARHPHRRLLAMLIGDSHLDRMDRMNSGAPA
ncbi:aminoglycoside phosphotransferase family protein [Iamia sp. SCSIO 61187]|uniref:phosphotransferase family protein n=1 Tax=Iamia sp. SCSIO 61187 TaxID=2722752 RepID=UPI001C63911E|nr:aminoglycoside phosphotransferase family protein [Iamia sp. SCSIO 61187]QYG93918.1 aminoglycoside phosphotransferase family protein [Iamia sp. SCSIO 61187]